MNRPIAHVAVFVALLVLAGCSHGGGGVSTDASYFQGLPAPVVAEALANPTVQRNLQGDPQAMQESLAQASVREILFCREGLRVYESWISTGTPPEVSPGPIPAHPIEPGNSAIKQDYANLKEAVGSGEPTQLQAMLSGEGSCGQWVPANPSEPNGSTIDQAVKGNSP